MELRGVRTPTNTSQMTRLLLLLLVMGMGLQAGGFSLNDPEWISFKTTYNKTYSHRAEEAVRLAIFKDNLRRIEEHNAGGSTFSMGVNQLADLTNAEYRSLLTAAAAADRRPAAEPGRSAAAVAGPTPASKDWRDEGAVTSVRDVGNCDASWAFSAAGAVEGAWKIAGNWLVKLSAQQLLDCSQSYGSRGCDGGLPRQAFSYLASSVGMAAEVNYPYEAATGRCRFDETSVAAYINWWIQNTRGVESELEYKVGAVGPVSAVIDGSHTSFQLYSHGVYQDRKCSSTNVGLGVLIVGYGVENGVPYWLVKNAWGYGWGDGGYIKMRKDFGNHCGIATDTTYPIVKWPV